MQSPSLQKTEPEKNGLVVIGKDSECAPNGREEHTRFLLRNIETIADILEALYNSPDHGNKSNLMDELIFIHLSKKWYYYKLAAHAITKDKLRREAYFLKQLQFLLSLWFR